MFLGDNIHAKTKIYKMLLQNSTNLLTNPMEQNPSW
jgi:hypothetical protein